MNRFVRVWVGLCLSINVFAGEPIVETYFLDSSAMYEKTRAVDRHRLLLSAPIKINGQWVFERDARVKGVLVSHTYELASEVSFSEAGQRLRQYFASNSGRLLYSCEGLDCGSSNVWANEVFKVKQLYGIDSSQFYQVWELNRNDQAELVVSYLSQRGNRRTYLQVDRLTVNQSLALSIASDPKSLWKNVESNGYWVLPGDLSVLEQNVHLTSLAEALKLNPLQYLAIVGHAYGGESFDQNSEQSKALAETVLQYLIAQGVSGKRIRAEGVGSMAPRVRMQNGLQRVELVIQP
ncbi:DUF4892 domain-containing protein [Teredinibacter purpureus]|jgi:Outer membrane protein and related peptidoglycan-associated (lipo)proteins|uniref:DUF4892 domain-containing protein n=1 Tax=Teredinibacter purpureus TaxID=2731756 RepID=UPI0005F835B1|nr:DUF4892 domain-containing protein [Teredinibacter purpureus]